MATFRPRQPFVTVDRDGVRRRFDPTTLVSDGHWVLDGRGELFETVEEAADRLASAVDSVTAVEQATAAPRERRDVRRPAKN